MVVKQTEVRTMKNFFVVIHGHIGRLLDPITDCKIAKNEKEAIAICNKDKEGDTGYIKVRLNKKVSDLYVKKIALAEIW